ncbi:MAG: hypothetical protein HY904_14930 [Deltaproteobacteria bacterium]|nr:hypothetical protein [Deltaproteobacteria bacterium]
MAKHSHRPRHKGTRPKLPAFVAPLASLEFHPPDTAVLQALVDLEDAFGFVFPAEARRALVGQHAFTLQGGGMEPLRGDALRRLNGLAPGSAADATAWATSRLGLLVVAADDAGNRLCLDVLDPSGAAPVYLCTARMGLAASATPAFPCGTDLLHAWALYTAGAEARQAAEDVERLGRELEALRKRRPSVTAGRDEALARLQAAFGGAREADTGPAPTAEDESRMAGELEAAREKHKRLWMPFMEQFSRWPVYWRLLWNGPNSLTFQTEVLDQPLVDAWRNVFPLAGHLVEGRVEALRSELTQREPRGRAALAFAEAHLKVGDEAAARAALAAWDAAGLGPRPARARRLLDTTAPATAPTGDTDVPVDWPAELQLSRKAADRFLSAVGAQFAHDLRHHGTTNVLGATKAAVRKDAHGRNIVEAGLGHVPLEVRKALFEGRPVELPHEFLRALNRELTRRLHQPGRAVDRVLTRLRLVVERHVNARTPLVVPHVGAFRVKNEPAPNGQSRFYLLFDPAPALVAAAQHHVVHEVSTRLDDAVF